jgi:hypothetical protein
MKIGKYLFYNFCLIYTVIEKYYKLKLQTLINYNFFV